MKLARRMLPAKKGTQRATREARDVMRREGLTGETEVEHGGHHGRESVRLGPVGFLVAHPMHLRLRLHAGPARAREHQPVPIRPLGLHDLACDGLPEFGVAGAADELVSHGVRNETVVHNTLLDVERVRQDHAQEGEANDGDEVL